MSDNASYFAVTFLTSKLHNIGVRRTFSTPYYPKGNSIAENFNRTLQRHLSIMETQYDAMFDECLSYIMLIHNTTPQVSTHETPAALMYALDPVLPIGDYRGMWNYRGGHYNPDTHWRLVQQSWDEAMLRILKNIEVSEMKVRSTHAKIRVGDFVFKELSPYEIEIARKAIKSEKLL